MRNLYILIRTLFLLRFWYFLEVRQKLRCAVNANSGTEFDCKKKHPLESNGDDDDTEEQLENTPSFKRKHLPTDNDNEKEMIVKRPSVIDDEELDFL